MGSTWFYLVLFLLNLNRFDWVSLVFFTGNEDSLKELWWMLALSEFHPFISLLIGLNWTPNQATFTSCVSWDSNGFSWGFTQCYWIFTKVAPFYWVLLGLTGCPPILLGSIVFFAGFPIV